MRKNIVMAWAIFAAAGLLTLSSCDADDPAVPGTLQAYIDAHPQWLPFDELVACAAGGQVGFLDDPSQPLSMFYYPKLYSTNFKYYETASAEVDPDDLSLYVEKEMDFEPLFNGFMSRFPIPAPDQDRWARVSFISNDTLWYCKPVRYKYYEKPTEYAEELLQVDLTQVLAPVFTWTDGRIDENIIYFQIVVDERGDAISATYTEERRFQFYDTENVVFNVTRPGPVLPLSPGKRYSIVLMGISADNWVNLISRKFFTTG